MRLQRLCSAELRGRNPSILPQDSGGLQIDNFIANFEKLGDFLSALAMKKIIWRFFDHFQLVMTHCEMKFSLA